jgi:guanylate kinase
MATDKYTTNFLEKGRIGMKAEVNIITLTGPSGSGKTTIARELMMQKPGLFAPVKSTTTRDRRTSDLYGEYEYVSKEQFAEIKENGEFLWTAEMPDVQYGTRRTHVRSKFGIGQIGVMILVPEVLPTLRSYVEDQCGEGAAKSFFVGAGLSRGDLSARLKRREPDISDEKVHALLSHCALWAREVMRFDFPVHFLENRDCSYPGKPAAKVILNNLSISSYA